MDSSTWLAPPVTLPSTGIFRRGAPASYRQPVLFERNILFGAIAANDTRQ